MIRVIKTRIMRWPGNMTRLGERRGAYREVSGKEENFEDTCRGKDHIKMDLRHVEWRGWGTWTGSIWLKTGTGGGIF
jgi:hypothetical protein